MEQRVVGEGGFGSVYKCTHRKYKTVFAVKAVKLNAIHSQHLRAMHHEIFALRHLQHPNIVRATEVFFGSSVVYVVMEYCTVQLIYLYYEHNRIREDHLRNSFLNRGICELMNLWQHF